MNNSEKEVWKTVEKYTKKIIEGNIDGFLNHFHKDYLGWNYEGKKPVNKVEIKNELSTLPKIKIHSYKLRPVSIQIKNKVAIVHYYYSAEFKDNSNVIKSKIARNTDILVEENSEWVLIGDHVDQSESITKTIKDLELKEK